MQLQVILNLFFTILIALCGLFIALFPWMNRLQEVIFSEMRNHAYLFSLIGIFLFALGSISFKSLLGFWRRGYFKRVKGINRIWVEDGVFTQHLDGFLSGYFPGQSFSCRSTFKNNRLHLFIELPFVNKEEQKELLEACSKDLREYLLRHIGYSNDFELSVSFAAQSDSSQYTTQRVKETTTS